LLGDAGKDMKHNREFEIAWQGLKPGVHNYQYTLDDAFMKAKEVPEELHDWKMKIAVNFDKHSDFFRLHFDVDGTVVTACDRCGDDFELKLWDEFDLLVKLAGDNAEDEPIEDEADVVFIPRHETVLDISDWLYEFAMLSVPLQRIHPDAADGKPGCNPQALQLLQQLSEPEDEQPHGGAIWKGLEALKEKKIEDNEQEVINKKKTK